MVDAAGLRRSIGELNAAAEAIARALRKLIHAEGTAATVEAVRETQQARSSLQATLVSLGSLGVPEEDVPPVIDHEGDPDSYFEV